MALRKPAMIRTTLLVALVSVVAAVTAQGRPSPPQSHLSVAVEATLVQWTDFPVTLTLKSGVDGIVIHSDDIELYLLGEDGTEVAQGVFKRIDQPKITQQSQGHPASAVLTLRWDEYVSPEYVKTGKRYQLVATCKQAGLDPAAGSTWFTLAAKSEP
jgi:hypothetical protein